MHNRTGKLTLSMVVRNEASRYLRRALESHRTWIDEAVIIDDASTDETAAMCEEVLAGIPLYLIRNPSSRFSNEVELRKQQWEATVATNPNWIMNLDGDEIFEDGFSEQINDIMNHRTEDVIYFRLYDMWNESAYREDQFWKAHLLYRPFLLRYRADMPVVWNETAQHCGRFPTSISQLSYYCHPARLKHYGWATEQDRIAKYERYKQLDPDGRFGNQAQYNSILDPSPHLVPWSE